MKLRPEELFQIQTREFLDYCALPGVFYFHPAQEAIRSPVTWAIQKKMGFVKGVPDWIFLRMNWCGMIELKVKKDLTTEQRAVANFCTEHRIPHEVCRSIDSFIEVCQRWKIVR